MADYSIDVAINADDNASPVMEKVADSAKTMGDAIKDVGQDGGTELKSFTQNIKDLDREITTVGRSMTAFGAGITASFTAPILAGAKAAWDQVDAVEQATVALRAYETDASAVSQVLSELIQYARSDMGVLFQREELFGAAQGLAVMGAETSNLVEYVEILSRSVGLGMGQWEDLIRVVGRVGAQARLTGIDFDLLTRAGFVLDDSLRNASITWEELFDALDRGIPANALEGQAETIRGAVIRLQSAVRDLGADFLAIDRETSTFISGGLGDQLVSGLLGARDAMGFFSGAATVFGNNLAFVMQQANALGGAIGGMSSDVSTAITVFGTATGLALTFGGALMVLAPRIVAIQTALRTLAGGGGVGMLLTRFSLIGAAISTVIGVGSLLVNNWMEQQQAAQQYDDALNNLGDTLELVRRQGDASLALIGDAVKNNIDSIRQSLLEFDDIEMPDPFDFRGADEGAYGAALAEAEAAINAVRSEADLATPALAAFNAAITDPNVDADAYARWALQLLDVAVNSDDAAERIDALNQIIDTQNEMPTEFLTAYADETDRAATALGEFMEAERAAHADREGWFEIRQEMRQREREEEEAQRQQLLETQQAWLENTAALGGWSDALSLINMSSMGSDMSQLAVDARSAGDALDNTFRIIVTNAQNMQSSIQQVSDSISGLFEVNDQGWSQMDTLLANSRIEWDEYVAAQDASVVAANAAASAQESVNTIIARQAPYLADAAAASADYLLQVSEMEAGAQRTALAFMDMDTVVQAHEIVLHGAGIAATRFGEQGQQAFEAMVQGALAANPLLFEVLETMGILEGTSVDFDINWDALREGASDMDRLITSIEHLVSVLAQIYDIDLNVDIETNAEEVSADIEAMQQYLADLEAHEATLDLSFEGDAALNEMELVYQRVMEIDGTESFLIMSVNAETGELEEFGRIIDSYTDEEQVTHIKVQTDDGEFWTTIDNATGDIGEARILVIPEGATAEDIMAMLDIPDSVDIQVNAIPGGVGVGDGTGGASNWREMLGLPEKETVVIEPDVSEVQEAIAGFVAEPIEVSFTADTSDVDSALEGFSAEPIEVLFQPNTSQIDSLDFMALDFTVEVLFQPNTSQIESLDFSALDNEVEVLFQPNTSQIESLDFSALDTEVEVVFTVDRSALDLEIANLSGAIGGGSDPNAFSPTVIVVFEADTSAIQLENLGLPDDLQIEVAITANMGGPDGLLTAVDNALIEIAGKSAEVAITLAADDAISRLDEIVRVVNDLQAAYIQIDIGLAADGAINTLNEIVRVVNDLQASSTTISITTNAEEVLGTLATVNLAVSVLNMAQATVTIGETGSGETIGAITNVGGELAGLHGNEAIVNISATGEAEALSAIHSVRDELAALHGNEAVVTIEAINNASSVIEAVSGQLSALDGRRATSYVDTVNRTFNQTFGVGGGGFHQRMGGVIGHAMGGVIAELAEAGGEMLHFANGGQVPVYDRGYYEVDRGAYVSPHSNNESMGDGLTINLNVAGSITTEERLIERAADRIARTLAKSTRRRMMGSGNR